LLSGPSSLENSISLMLFFVLCNPDLVLILRFVISVPPYIDAILVFHTRLRIIMDFLPRSAYTISDHATGLFP